MNLNILKCEECENNISINTRIHIIYISNNYIKYLVTCGLCGHTREYCEQIE